MSERDILAELANATEENPVIIERPLTVDESIIAFNDNVFGAAEAHNDWQYTISIKKEHLELIRTQKGSWWGSLEPLFRYAMQNAIDLGYIPFSVEKVGESDDSYDFHLLCEDRRISRNGIEADVRCSGKCTTECSGLGQP